MISSQPLAIVGATGNVGRQVVEMLLLRGLATPAALSLYASLRSAGKNLHLGEHSFSVETLSPESFEGKKLCVFTTEAPVSAEWIPHALAAGAYVIDASSHYRLHPEVPLIVPPVNRDQITSQIKLYAHANCLTSPIATVIAPLHRTWKILRLEATTFQSTAGAGKAAMEECTEETRALLHNQPYHRSIFPRQIAGNVIPQVGELRSDGFTTEEYKIREEVKKVVDTSLAITATAVRVPVLIGHSIALTVEFSEPFSLEEVKKTLSQAPSVQLSTNDYSTPVEVVGSDDVWVGRIRRDPSRTNSLQMWLCSDNLRRGAATDAVEIAEEILAHI